VEIFFSDELRLVYALLLQTVILVGAWRFVARRVMTDWADRAADVLLISLLVQYASVALPGVMGVLNPWTIALSTVALSGGLFFVPWTRGNGGTPPAARLSSPKSTGPAQSLGAGEVVGGIDRWVVVGCALFGLGYMVALNLNQCIWPVMANDALTYHFPAAVRWLHTGRLSLWETWFFNPANTYSPLAGSTFVAWWIAPVGHDALARNVQSPALLLIFFAGLRLMRAIGVRAGVAGVLALALLLARPFVRQSIIEKDDLYLVAFFGCAAAGMARERLRDPLGMWRVGAALGLMLATKYTALMALPALLLMADTPKRAGWTWRRYGVAVALVLVIAGPWYLRNLIAYHNPFYPIRVTLAGKTVLPGLFESARSTQLSRVGSIASILMSGDQSLPMTPMVVLLIGAVMAAARWVGRIGADPLVRGVLVGPVLLLGIFVATSPYAEVRFVYPAFFLLFGAGAAGIAAWVRPGWAQYLAAGVVLVTSAVTTFSLIPARVPIVMGLFAAGSLTAAIGLCLLGAVRIYPGRAREITGWTAGVAVLVLAGFIFVSWRGYLRSPAGCRAAAVACYRTQYDAQADAWQFVRDNLPPRELLAYSNTVYVHPLSGFENDRPLVYVPTRRGVTHLSDLPPFTQKLSGEQIVPAVSAALTADTDAQGWLERIKATGAKHLIVFRSEWVAEPPELAIAAGHPERFEVEYENDVARVFRVK